jgi:type I restriction enzyme S subunit
MVAGRWIRAKIGDCSIVGDGAHARIQRQTSGVMYLTSRNLKDGCIDLSKVDYISNDDFERHFRDDSKALTKPKADDVVFSIIGTIGEPYLVQKQDRFGISSSVAILRPNCQVVQPQYVYYWIKGHIFQDALYGIKGGVAQGYVSLEMIRSLPLYYPPLPTQRKIAAILSAYDDLIENNTRRIAVLEEMAQAIYREWFVHFRFPGYEGVRMVESELGPVPEGWKVVCYSDILQSFLGGDWGKETPTEKEDHPVTVIRGTDFNDVTFGNMLRTPHRYISEASVAKRKLIPGDVIVENSVNASSRCVGSSLLVTQEMLNQIRSDAICASFCKSFRPKSQQFGVLIDLHIKY